MKHSLVVTDLKEEIPALFQYDCMSRLILAVQRIGCHGGVVEIDFGTGQELLGCFEFMAFAFGSGHHGDRDALFGVHQADEQAQVITNDFTVDGQCTRQLTATHRAVVEPGNGAV